MKRNQHYMGYLFAIKGGFSIDSRLTPNISALGEVVGFTLPDGRGADLCVCLRVEGGSEEEFAFGDSDMERLGFESLDYELAEFYRNPENDE